MVKQRELFVVSSEQKCKSLQGRWAEKKNEEDTRSNAGGDTLNMGFRCGRHVNIKVGKKDDK